MFFLLRKELIRDDLPTLDLPRKAISGNSGGGRSFRLYTLLRNFIFFNMLIKKVFNYKRWREAG